MACIRITKPAVLAISLRWYSGKIPRRRKKAKTEFGKDSSNNIQPMVGLDGRNVSVLGNALQLGMNSSSDFKGDSKADQSNSLSG